MKLLKLKIGSITENFRSLQAGFEINFHTLDNTFAMENFRPFCFAGLNGSGKSNVLEALSAIFYHLEFCVARYKPENFKKYFKSESCAVDAFTLEYLIGQHNRNYTPFYFDKVTIEKEVGKAPVMFVKEFSVVDDLKGVEVSLIPSKNNDTAAEGKRYLPAHIIGYSSGENEILSLPFIKSRLVHLDEFKQATRDNYSSYDEPENSLIYIDNNMSQAVLLACLLFEDPNTTLKPLENEVGILGMRSFRMNINLHQFNLKDKNSKVYSEPINKLLDRNQIEKLKSCATTWYSNENHLWLDFYVSKETKHAFKDNFNNSFELFQLLRLLYELNAHFIDEKIVEEVYKSQGYYTDGKLPIGSPSQNVFYFEDFYIIKKNKQTGLIKDLLLRNFSDGEHQFLHTMGICLLLKDRRALLLLDEPETHFNPSWRAKFIKILADSITLGNEQDHPNGNFNVHLLKDVLLTSHSPFIISDCMPDNVILFEKDENGTVIARKVSEIDSSFNTFGTSVEIILERLFNYDQSIGDLSNEVIESIDFETIKSSEDVGKAKSSLRKLGESIEKDMVLARLNRINKEN
jgi:restriction system-associated AAA family ATPase